MSFFPVQSQGYLLYGNGAVIGNTTIILSSFKDIDGNNLAMSDFGTIGTGTLEPNAGSNEEQIIFTGVTQNVNGTATLTGVSSVGFKTPYTQTSGVIKSHAGNSTFVLSDTAFLYTQYASLPGSQTFTGTDTFSISPFIPTVASTATNQAASVGYVNAIAVAGAPKASNTVFGITELSVAAVTASVPIAVGDNDGRVPTQGENDALVGTSGTPSSSNKYVTNDDTAAAATGSKVARRNAAGDVTVNATPTNATDAASKQYADTKLAGLGAWTTATADGAGHQVTTDGFLVLNASGNSVTGITVKSDSASTPTVTRAISNNASSGLQVPTITCPVKKNDYYLITVSGSPTTSSYLFIPIS